MEVIEGTVSAKQIEGEFKALAGEGSTWRWYAKRIADRKYQMRFPTTHALHTATHFHNVRLQSDTSAVLKVWKWTAEIGAKGKLPEAWSRIKGIPMEKRSIPNVCRVSLLVGRAK